MRTHHENTAHEIHGEYRWRHFGDGAGGEDIHDGTLEEAAIVMKLDPNEIAWAIEEYGRCDTGFADEEGHDEIVCWKPGEPWNDTSGEPAGGGWEWPATEAPKED